MTIPYVPAQNAQGLLLTAPEITAAAWNALNDDEKNQVILVYASDKFRTSPIGEVYKMTSDVAQSAGLVGTLAFAIPLS